MNEVELNDSLRPNSELNCFFSRIPDVEKNGYCFTDGVGRISWGLAGRIAQRLNIRLERKVLFFKIFGLDIYSIVF